MHHPISLSSGEASSFSSLSADVISRLNSDSDSATRIGPLSAAEVDSDGGISSIRHQISLHPSMQAILTMCTYVPSTVVYFLSKQIEDLSAKASVQRLQMPHQNV